MKKYKIISILASSPTQDKLIKRFNNIDKYFNHYKNNIGGIDYLDVEEPIKKVFFYHQDFSVMQAKEILKRTDKYNIECWRPYIGINITYSKIIDGITHKIIPQYKKKDILGRSKLVSKDFDRELKKEIQKGNVLVIHSYPGSFITKIWLHLKPVNIPVIAIHRGGSLLNFQKKNGYKKFTSFIKHRWELKCLRDYIDYFLETCKVQANYLEKKGIEKVINLYPNGVDFELFTPTYNKIEIKDKLGLPIDKKIILYVGRFTRVKDVDFLLETYNELKNDRNDIQLLLIGGNIEDEFYDMGVKAGAVMIERLSQEKLVEYQQVADVYLLPIRNNLLINFAGIGSAVIESLACGVPAISDNLIHFEGGEKEINKVGRLLGDKETLKNNINYLLDHPEEFTEVREYAGKYYEKGICTKKLIIRIGELFEKYYGK
jgi:glycosyltransferase involved in cell wall biosynthesis